MAEGDFSKHYGINTIKNIARLLRKKQTRSEEQLWQALRNRQLIGLKFLRQHPVGPSVVDFYCHEKKLAIEIDGPLHDAKEVAERDKARQELIEAYGIHFFRCTAKEVEQDLGKVLAKLRKSLE